MHRASDLITGGFSQSQLDAWREQVHLVALDKPHDCFDPEYLFRHRNCFCQRKIARKFHELIQNTMVEGGFPKDHYMNARWVVRMVDDSLFDIFGPTIVLTVEARSIAERKLLGKEDEPCGELILHSRVSPKGTYDCLSNYKYCWDTDWHEEAEVRGTVDDLLFWIRHPQLKELTDNHVDRMIAQFCYVMEMHWVEEEDRY